MLLGAGGREHAIAIALAKDPAVSSILAAPGNPGIEEFGTCVGLDILDADAVVALAKDRDIDLVIIGPETAMIAGVGDALREAGIPVFGAGAEVARLESSKSYAKAVMAALDIPAPMSRLCSTVDQVEDAMDIFGAPYVVKDDGLAAGKGVIVTSDREAALRHAMACFARNAYDETPAVVVEEFIDGEEVSITFFSDGWDVVALLPAQDYKRFSADDGAPNTSGMGAYTPLTWLPANFVDDVTDRVALPLVREMAHQKTPLIGPLTLTAILGPRGLRVLEFDVHMGDPESQVVLPLLRKPFGQLVRDGANSGLANVRLEWESGFAVGVVLSAKGYPGKVRTGDPLRKVSKAAKLHEVSVLHGGTSYGEDGDIVSNAGRVLTVVAVSSELESARKLAYEAVEKVKLADSYYRKDIAAHSEIPQNL